MEEKFSSLESDVENKGQALQEDLANKYTEATDKVNADIEAMQAANKGLWDSIKEGHRRSHPGDPEAEGPLPRDPLQGRRRVQEDHLGPDRVHRQLLRGVKNGFMGFVGSAST